MLIVLLQTISNHWNLASIVADTFNRQASMYIKDLPAESIHKVKVMSLCTEVYYSYSLLSNIYKLDCHGGHLFQLAET